LAVCAAYTRKRQIGDLNFADPFCLRDFAVPPPQVRRPQAFFHDLAILYPSASDDTRLLTAMMAQDGVVNPTTSETAPKVTVSTATTPLPASAELAAVTHVRLPGFWHHSPRQWFTHADAVFHSGRIRSDLARVNHVLASLDEDGIRAVSDILGEDATYDALRARLINTYTVPRATRFQSIIQPGGMGDRTPSRLLRDMRDVYPDDMGDASLEQFWMQKLPPAVRTVIAGLSGSLDALAERADRVMEAARGGTELAAVSAPPKRRFAAIFPTSGELEPEEAREVAATSNIDARITTLENAVRALSAQVASFTQHRSTRDAPQPPPPTRDNNTTGWCYYHDRYGPDARKCREPCTFAPPTRKNP